MFEFDGVRRSFVLAAGSAALVVISASGVAYGGGMAAPVVQVSMNDYMADLCARAKFSPEEIERIQKSANYAEILEYALENCPEIAALLADQATATIPGLSGAETGGGEGGGGEGGGGEGGGGEGGGGEGGGGEGGGGEGGGGEGGGGGGGGNNGHGNGDQDAPGNSGDNNNAENSENSGQGNSGNGRGGHVF